MVNLKKKLLRAKQHRKINSSEPCVDSWTDDDGLHFVGQGKQPSPEDYDKMTRNYQAKIKKSPMYAQWVQQFGKTKAAEMLKECVAKSG